MFGAIINQNFGDGNNFEHAIRTMLRARGISAIKPNDDKGTDIIATIWLNGREVIFNIQCKYHNKAVGMDAIHQAYSGTQIKGNNGYPVVITNNRVTAEARKAAKKLGVEIIAAPEWQELQDSATDDTIYNREHRGLMGLLLSASVTDMEFSQAVTEELMNPTPIEAAETSGHQRELDAKKQILKEIYDEALLLEQEAAEYERKASYNRKASIEQLKRAAFSLMDYG